MIAKEDWFVDWFDSYHYHLLYQNRDFKEAELFIKKLFDHLKLKSSSKVLDLACGKGRHAMQVHQLGFDVLGVDLSEKSIAFAQQHRTKGLDFKIADMRELEFNNQFDLVLNLFTSFGYFKKEGDNKKVIASMARSLKSAGVLVLDFLNVEKVIEHLPFKETIKRGEIDFQIDKLVADGFIEKRISFQTNGKQFEYKEFVKMIRLEMFEDYFQAEGLELISWFGDYSLTEFNESESDRLILIARKK